MKDPGKALPWEGLLRGLEKDEPPLFSRCSPTPFNGQFALYLEKEEPLLFSKLNPINKGTPVTFYGPPSVSVLTGLTVL